jgi:hypothetical protein
MEMFLKQVDNPRKLVPMIRNCIFGYSNVKPKNYNLLNTSASGGDKPYGESITEVTYWKEFWSCVVTVFLILSIDV